MVRRREGAGGSLADAEEHQPIVDRDVAGSDQRTGNDEPRTAPGTKDQGPRTDGCYALFRVAVSQGLSMTRSGRSRRNVSAT
jgi:hypothetical protein